MQRKKRILFVTESHKLASGFGTYGKEVISRIHKSGKYEIAEFACYASPRDFDNTDWLIYGNAPVKGEDEYAEQHTKSPHVQWGVARFEYVVLDFKPDIVVTYRDPWMDAYIADSVLLPYFHWVWMPTVDSAPQKSDWLYMFDKCDDLLAYSEYGIRTLSEQTQGRVCPVDVAPPAIDPNVFNIIPNKRKHKESVGIDPDSIIFGTVMRNQKRKMFPDLMLSFKKYLEKAPKDIAEKSFLYLHTSFPEKSGWDITSVIHELGLGSKVLVTYVCRHCKKYFVSNFRDAICQCDYCKNISATMPGVQNGIEHSELHKIYNLMDLYIQYAICEGFGMPQVEAAACGTPIASIDYSAMEDVVRYCNGYPIKPHLQREMETNADRSSHNNDHLVEIMLSFASQSEPEIKKQRLQTRKGCITRYNWDRTAKVWEDYFDSIKNFKESHGKWDEPPKVKEFPKELPKDMSHGQFCELMFTQVIQDPKEMFGYKMLSMLRNLNFGADIERGLESCSQESVFKENMGLAERRLFFDKLRTKQIGVNTPSFIAEAHRRLKK